MTRAAPIVPPSERGFTLIELLVGLVVLALAATLMLAGISGISAMARRASSGASDDATVSSAQIVLRDRLEHLEAINRGDAAKPVADVEGSERAFDFIGPPPPGAGLDALQRYRLRLSAAGDVMLYRISTSNDRIDQASPSVAGWTAATVLRGVRAISLAYYGGASARSGAQWRSVWRQQPRPPELVRLRISFVEGDRRIWPTLVVRPSASLPPACTPDADGSCSAG